MMSDMMINILFMCIQIGDMYSTYKNENIGGNLYSFFTHQEVEKRQANQESSAEFIKKIDLYNKVIRTVWIALFFFVMAEMFLYLEDKKKHWSTKLYEMMEKKGDEDEETSDKG